MFRMLYLPNQIITRFVVIAAGGSLLGGTYCRQQCLALDPELSMCMSVDADSCLCLQGIELVPQLTSGDVIVAAELVSGQSKLTIPEKNR